MKNITLMVGIVIALVIGAGVGYSYSRGSSDLGVKANELQGVTSMMQEQSATMHEMAEMMMSGGLVMQEMGLKYKDDTMMSKGKDLEAVGKKYSQENAGLAGGDAGMEANMH